MRFNDDWCSSSVLRWICVGRQGGVWFGCGCRFRDGGGDGVGTTASLPTTLISWILDVGTLGWQEVVLWTPG